MRTFGPMLVFEEPRCRRVLCVVVDATAAVEAEAAPALTVVLAVRHRINADLSMTDRKTDTVSMIVYFAFLS
jgi:hypothetical protein